MHIVCSTDDNYVMPTGIMLTSLCVNNPKIDIHVHVLFENLKESNIKSLTKTVEFYNKRISFYPIEPDLFSNFPMGKEYQNSHIQSMATYYRLYMAEILPPTIDKVIYLDGDIIVRGPLDSLWKCDISNYYIGGVPDEFNNRTDHYNRLKYPQSQGYFNAGVILVNLKKWRETNIINDFLLFIKNYPERLFAHDQDVLNYIFRESKITLEIKYNMQNAYFYKKEYNCLSWEFEEQLLEGQRNPVLVHFTYIPKPWYKNCYHPYKNEFLYYKKLSLWKEYPTNKIFNYRKYIKELLKQLLVKLKVLSPKRDMRTWFIK